MSETLTAQGTLDGIEEKASGWFEIKVAMPGKDYPLKLATKKQELVELARAARESGVMEWTYTEKDSGTPNPHRPGSNYINRYFEGVEPVGTSPNANAGSAAPSSQDAMSKEEWKLKDNAAHKRACIAIAVGALTHTMPADPSGEDLNRFLERVWHLSYAFHRNVLAERDDPTGEDVPF